MIKLYKTPFCIADFIARQGNVREHMEDGYVCESIPLNEQETIHVFGVFDGHSGKSVMEWLTTHVTAMAKEYYPDWTTMCLQMNKRLEKANMTSGSTMTLLIVIEHNTTHRYRMCTVNVGDSVIAGCTHVTSHPWKMRCKQCIATFHKITTSHDLDDPSEKARIYQAVADEKAIIFDKQYVSSNGEYGINMTRAFGDFEIGNDLITPIPEVIYIQEPLCFVSLASDGIWDSLETPKEILQWLQKDCKDETLETLNTCMMNRRSERTQHDNFTMGVVFFNTSLFIPWT